jgi:uracil-DNA glycosylase family 4
MDANTTKQIRAWLEREVALGLDLVPAGPSARQQASAVARSASSGEGAPAAANMAARAAATLAATAALKSADATALSELLVEPAIRSSTTLDELRTALGECERCKLCKGRTNIVFGVGDPHARLMFVGEGPGEDEDRAGKPFVGKAGALLDDIITKGMGLRRDDVYIANVVKCRPPNNRNPEPDEIVACEPFLRRQIELVRPEVVVSLGNFATQALLGDRTPISRRRGRWHEFAGVSLMPTFHPAYLLRNPSDKGLVWSDIKLVMARLGLAQPQRARP